jgi:hypothetical protein
LGHFGSWIPSGMAGVERENFSITALLGLPELAFIWTTNRLECPKTLG